jgi:hypothetical protein
MLGDHLGEVAIKMQKYIKRLTGNSHGTLFPLLIGPPL